MVINTIVGCNYAYGRPITAKNVRKLRERIVDGVCENADHMGNVYHDGMVYIGSVGRVIHTPAAPKTIPALMDQLFAFWKATTEDVLIRSFVAHFYFVYVYPFCDGNGRAALILNASHLYHGGY